MTAADIQRVSVESVVRLKEEREKKSDAQAEEVVEANSSR